jgi:branched-chain amino acid transport system permease protein
VLRLARRGGGLGLVLGLLLVLNLVNSNLIDSYQDMLLQAGVAIVLAVSLNIVNGFTGQFSIGHAGFMAVGAYAGGALSYPLWDGAKSALKAAHPGWSDAQILQAFASSHWWLVPTAMLLGGAAAALFGWLVGVPSLRLRGDYLAIVTLGFGEIIRVLLNNVEKIHPKLGYLGGSLGFYGVPKLTTFLLVYATAALVIALTRNLKVSLHGLAYQSIREDEVAADAMGVNTTGVKVAAFMLGAFFAGMSGALYGHGYLFSPMTFNFLFSMNLVVMVVLGGTGSITGVAIAAVVLTAIPELLKNVKDSIPWFQDEYRLMIYALILILMMILRPQGVFGRKELSFARFRRRVNAEPSARASGQPGPVADEPGDGPILEAVRVTRRFGGLVAVNDFNLAMRPGELVGLIGPNGAGKTTIFNLLTGVYEPSSGEVRFRGRVQAGERLYSPVARTSLLALDAMLAGAGGWIAGSIVSSAIVAEVRWPAAILAIAASLVTAPKRRRTRPGPRPCEFAARGIARTFQNIRLFPELTVLQNVMLGSYVRRKTHLFDALFRTTRMENEDRAVEAHARELLRRFGLESEWDSLARNLPYGDQRRLEIARALATEPKLLLLDEPAAGMNPQEKSELMADILLIRKEFGLTILLIEHDMKVVMGICERIYVLDYGEIIAEGSPEEIQRNPKVIAAYLGEEAAHA